MEVDKAKSSTDRLPSKKLDTAKSSDRLSSKNQFSEERKGPSETTGRLPSKRLSEERKGQDRNKGDGEQDAAGEQMDELAIGADMERISSKEMELGSLISFSNLENVMRHIIKKFKSIESHSDAQDESMRILRKEMSSRATMHTLDEVANDIRGKIENYNQTLTTQRDILKNIENQCERMRVMNTSLEKKLEVSLKEKAVQDRLLREVTDSLQDKVAVAELNMFEAKFAGYTTKLEHQDVLNLLSHYTRTDVSERIAESVRMLGTQFEDYSRTAKIEQQFQEFRDWVTDELANYAKQSTTTTKFEEVAGQIRENALSFERVHSMMDDKIRAMSDRITSVYSQFHNDIQECALEVDLKALTTEMSKYALRMETEVFQQDCGPKLKFCVDSIRAFDKRLNAQDDAIRRVDEVLLDKAGKYDIVVANSRIEQCFKKDKAVAEFKAIYERLDWMSKNLEQYIEAENDRLGRYKPPDYTYIFEDIRNRIELKADKADLVEIYQVKANRIDADELSKLQDLIHRQLEYLAVTTFGLAKLALTETKVGESKTVRVHQKSQVLTQAEALWHWILHNQVPPNLESLRPPSDKAARPGKAGGPKSLPPLHSDGELDQDKRQMDDVKRGQLERKLGVAA